ncbi:MAG: hypothetical protein QCI82_07230 [Candidatus Thermoplasmatota archaeon]|nr:hypothetical protein [Candidatus Thermoplasmatota archaeon]
MGPSSRSTTLLMIAAILSLLAASFLHEEADAIGEVAVSIIMDPMPAIASVGPGWDGVVTYTGTIVATEPIDVQAQFAIVELWVDAGIFEVTEIAPIVLFSSTREARFSFSLQVPPGHPCTELTDIDEQVFSVNGRWRYEPGSITGDVISQTFILDIDQYYLYRVESPRAYMQTAPGSELLLQIKVINEGNGDDRIALDLVNKEMLESNGWTVQYQISSFTLNYTEERTITFRVTTPVKWHPYTNSVTPIKFSVSSMQAINDNALSEVVYHTFYIRQRGVSLPGLEIPLIVSAVCLAAVIGYVRKRC